MKTNMLRSVGLVAVSFLAVGSLAACGSDESSGSTATGDCSLPSEIKLLVIKDQTGVAAFVGQEAWKGIQLAQDRINDEGLITGSKITLELKDPGGNAQTAASQLTAGIADKDVSAVLGPVLSDQALAVSPLATKGKIPVVYTQAGSNGIVDQEYNFRATPPLLTYYPKVGEYLASKSVATIGTIYSSDNPTLTELATKILPDVGGDDGFEVTNTVATTATTQDFSSPVAKAEGGSPDAIALLMSGTQVASAAQQLEQSGFDGQVVTYPAAATGVAEIGDPAAGYVWPTNFDASVDTPEVTDFVQAFGDKFDGATPSNYAAEGYDSLMWVAKAISEEGCASREAVKAGLEAVGNQGFTGVQGALTFEENGHDARTEGLLVQWDGSKVVVLQ